MTHTRPSSGAALSGRCFLLASLAVMATTTRALADPGFPRLEGFTWPKFFLFVVLYFGGILVGAYLLTALTETAVVLLYTRFVPGLERKRLIRTCLWVNLITLPVLWMAAGLAIYANTYRSGLLMLALESGVVAAEAFAYRYFARVPGGTAITISALANIASYCAWELLLLLV